MCANFGNAGLVAALCLAALPVGAADLASEIDRLTAEIEAKVVLWRRDFHRHPELSNREVRTARKVAEHLEALGLEVRTEVAHTGVVGLLRGGEEGPVIALRADMDALPVTELVDLPFASTQTTMYEGREVGVMHACGHDQHLAILMGVAEVLSGLREHLRGSVKFLFQPAEEGAPRGEKGGARLMIAEGALEDPRPEAIFGLHVFPYPLGTLGYRSGGIMASSDSLYITIHGRQTHGAVPWGGVDPIVVSSQVILGLQSIVSRQVDVTRTPSIITIGSIHGGVRGNIIPDKVEMVGTVRTFDPEVRLELHRRIRRTAESIAASAGATAEIRFGGGNLVTYNDPELTSMIAPTLVRVAGKGKAQVVDPTTTAEDFSHYQQEIPGVFFFLGVAPEGADPATVARNHSPHFFADEGALSLGVRALANVAVDAMENLR